MDRFRLDYLVANRLAVSRSVALKLIEGSKVKVEGRIVTEPDKKFEENAKIAADYSKRLKVSKLDLEILFENDDCVVINKPLGVLTHSKGAFNDEPSVASWLLPKTIGFEDNNRAGIAHRLDRATSGVMICAKNPAALSHFQKQFSSRKVKKKYYALIEGKIEPVEAMIDIPIERNPKDPKRFRASANGKMAKTHYKAIKSFIKNKKEYSLLELAPTTGRTHQLRVHLNYLKHPIVGDTFYEGLGADRLYLHAFKLEITLPGSERKVFTAELPDSFAKPKIVVDE